MKPTRTFTGRLDCPPDRVAQFDDNDVYLFRMHREDGPFFLVREPMDACPYSRISRVTFEVAPVEVVPVRDSAQVA